MDFSALASIKQTYPENLMARHFDLGYVRSLSPPAQARLAQVINSGVQNPDSQMGAYAMSVEDYELFQPYLDLLIRDYHQINESVAHQSDWFLSQTYDLRKISPTLAETSIRVRVGRNLLGYPMPGAMSQQDRVGFEQDMIPVIKQLIDEAEFGGSYVSLTPHSPYLIGERTYSQLVGEHKMFKDMSHDPYLDAAGISGDWPYGRGMYCSKDQQLIIWIGEEDQLRIVSMKTGSFLNEVFDRLFHCLSFLENQGVQFAFSPTYGAVTSCPTNLGTGMRASLHLALPALTQKGQNLTPLKRLTNPLGLSVRGIGGEHTEAGQGGVVDISPRARLQVTEAQICRQLYQGVEALWKAETTHLQP